MSAIKSFTVKQINKIQGKHRHLSRESREGLERGLGQTKLSGLLFPEKKIKAGQGY